MSQQEVPDLDSDIAVLLFGGSYANETRADLFQQILQNQTEMFVDTAELMVLLVEREIAEKQ